MGAIKQLDFTKSWEQSHSWILLDFTTSWEQSHSWILPRHGSNHTAGSYHLMRANTQHQVMGTITQLDFTTRHGSNHTAGFYHLIGAITAGFYQVMGAITQLEFTTRHRNNHTAGFYHVIGAITQLDFTKSWEQSHS